MKALVRAAVFSCICLGALPPTTHAADFIVTPFVGKTFAATSTLDASSAPAVGSVDKQTWIVGGSAAWLTSNIFGAEVDFGYAPRFFQSNQLLLQPGNNALSLTGNVLLAVPLSVSRESLRPYISAGMGLLHAGANDIASAASIDRSLAAVSIGGGAIGFLSSRAGVRFDLRHIRSTSEALNLTTGLNEPRLGFWRATIGVAIRY